MGTWRLGRCKRSANALLARGLQERTDFTGFNWSDVPVVLVEVGFMTKPIEDRRLATAAHSAAPPSASAGGTLRFLGRSVSASR
ncbi:MAG TPA: hypothetical protein VJK66_03560 [Gaiellaceae bacterium]|nr:hypothetical protein [Gaiellaceae bacterium]